MLHGADRERSQSGLSNREGNSHATSDPFSGTHDDIFGLHRAPNLAS